MTWKSDLTWDTMGMELVLPMVAAVVVVVVVMAVVVGPGSASWEASFMRFEFGVF